MAFTRRRFLLGLSASPLVAACRGSDEPQASWTASPPAAAADRSVTQVLAAMPTVDGGGVHLARALGQPALSSLDPFLLLDEIRSDRRQDWEKGFPRHPHRGFETVTYMLEGAMDHRDSVGNHGHLVGGSAQWMTAGRGIVHSEMPNQDQGLLWGLQLWVNLPARLKMTDPRYQDIAPSRIPEASVSGARTRVVAGRTGGVTGPVEGIVVAPTMLDVTVDPSSPFEQELPTGHAAFTYVLEGVARIGKTARTVAAGSIAVLGPGSSVTARGEGGKARLLLLAAAPIGEPIARSGPFVMNTDAECAQAWSDYRAGTLAPGT
jgi:redox-sensitive bicupin YhaK (pirin superfamily)